MKADVVKSDRQPLVWVTTATLASFGLGLAGTQQVQADDQSVTSSGVATVTSDVAAQQLSQAQTAVTQTSDAAATAKVVMDHASAANQVAQSAVASAQGKVDALSQAVSAAQLAQTVSSATSTVSAATSSANNGLTKVSSQQATPASTSATPASQPPARDENGTPSAGDEQDSFATDISTYEETATLLYTLYGDKIPEHDSSERNGLDATQVQAVIDEVATPDEQQVIPDGWEVLVSGGAYASDGIVYYNTDNTQFDDDVDQAAAWWNQNAGQTIFVRASADHPATAYITDYLNAHFSMLATTGTDGTIGLDVSLMEAFNYDPYNVIVHEMGHLLGLAHAPAAGDIMNASVPRGTFTFSQYDKIATKAGIKAYQDFRDTSHGNQTTYEKLSGYTPLNAQELALLSNPNFDQWHSLRSQLWTVIQRAKQLTQTTTLQAAEKQATDAANTLVVNRVTLTQVKAGVSSLLNLYSAMGKDSTDMYQLLSINLSSTTLNLENSLRSQLLGDQSAAGTTGLTTGTTTGTQTGTSTGTTTGTQISTSTGTSTGNQTGTSTGTGASVGTTTSTTSTGTPVVTTTQLKQLTHELLAAHATLKLVKAVATATSAEVRIATQNYEIAQQRAKTALIRYQALKAVVDQQHLDSDSPTSGPVTTLPTHTTSSSTTPLTVTVPDNTNTPQPNPEQQETEQSATETPAPVAKAPASAIGPSQAPQPVLPWVRDRPIVATMTGSTTHHYGNRNNQLPKTDETRSDTIFVGFVTLVMAIVGLFGVRPRRHSK